ncbi:phage head closure protein [Marinilactibacillus sp. XAAS-LB27]|uniref:phage head closure protein n=1 Tax=Marinilactibacillus sp. XAAS-LB27 TaxID=3114538 RepID=UPI002E19000C|nr:phage head closure protein [Marinilactibacillus sp. XAAS-LB27]
MSLSRTGKLIKRMKFKKRDGYDTGPNGTRIDKYKVMITPWFAYKQKYLEEIKREDSAYKNTVNIIIRQKQKEEIQPDWIAEINGIDYNIEEINPDVENEDFMVLILKAVS